MLGMEAIANYNMLTRMRGWWRWQKPSAGIAFTGDAVVALSAPTRTGDDHGGKPRYQRTDLPQGLVEVSATTPNVQSMSDLAQIVEAALSAVGALGQRLAVALPDLSVTTALFPGRGRASERELRKELGQALPYAVDEARCDFWRGRREEVLAAAVRDVIARQYEQVVAAAECRLAWVDAVSLVGIPSWSARPSRQGELVVDVQLYHTHYCLTVFRGGELVDARTKLRTRGDAELVSREVLRVPALHLRGGGEQESIDALSLFGAGAPDVADALADSDRVRTIRIESDDENRHLVSSIEMLPMRGVA